LPEEGLMGGENAKKDGDAKVHLLAAAVVEGRPEVN